mgnify:CR=1 FL=1
MRNVSWVRLLFELVGNPRVARDNNFYGGFIIIFFTTTHFPAFFYSIPDYYNKKNI